MLLLALKLIVATVAAAVPVALPGCPDACGNITVPYPFGIGHGCFRAGFNLTCDETQHPPRLSVGHNVQVLNISLSDGTLRIHQSRAPSASSSESAMTPSPLQFDGSWSAGLMDASPLAVSTRYNVFVATGCNLLASLTVNYNSSTREGIVSICAAMCQDDVSLDSSTSCSGVGCCQMAISQGSLSYGVQLKTLDQAGYSAYGTAFIVDGDWFSRNGDQFLASDATAAIAPTVLEWFLDVDLDSDLVFSDPAAITGWRCISMNSHAGLILPKDSSGRSDQSARCYCLDGFQGNPYIINGCQALAGPIAQPGCPETCGDVGVPYPFGIGEGCFHEGFNLTCDGTQHPPKLFIGDGVEVLDISLPDGTVRIQSSGLQSPFAEFNGSWFAPSSSTGTFKVSAARNSFVAFGCNMVAQLVPRRTLGLLNYASICAAVCPETVGPLTISSCSGVACCRTSIAPFAGDLPSYDIQVMRLMERAADSYLPYGTAAFIVDQDWFIRNEGEMGPGLLTLDA
ncbi:hypothetical protein EJB05_39938, partial [Eragrostis curvula]